MIPIENIQEFRFVCAWNILFAHSLYAGLQSGRTRGSFLESPGNFSCPKSCFMFTVFACKIKVSVIWNMIQWNCQLMKKYWLIVSKKLCYYSSGFKFKIRLQAPKITGLFAKRAPGALNAEVIFHDPGFLGKLRSCRLVTSYLNVTATTRTNFSTLPLFYDKQYLLLRSLRRERAAT